MNQQKLKLLVDNAVALHREIAAKTEQLKALKTDLIKQARLHPDEVEITESGGKRWTVTGSDGCIARVNFPAPALLSEVQAESDLLKQIQALTAEHFRELFTTVKSYQLVEDFRAEAASTLPKRKAEALMKLCESQSAPRVSFEAANRPALAVAA